MCIADHIVKGYDFSAIAGLVGWHLFHSEIMLLIGVLLRGVTYGNELLSSVIGYDT